MTKDFYEILGVSKTATPEEIKKAYRKLSLKWHPDRQSGKSLEEKEVANKKMQEINKVYEILGNEEKRKKYDLGETNFSDYGDDYQKAAWETKEEELRKKAKTMEEMVGVAEEEAKIMEEIWLLNADYIDRFSTVNEIRAAKGLSIPTVYTEDLESEGYSRLWKPYKSWSDKVWNMPITIIRGEKEESDELKQFKAEMLQAIKEVAIIIETKKKEKEKIKINSLLERDRVNAIEAIERELRERGLKAQDLGEYSNYKEQINNLDKQWKIRSLRDKIKQSIFGLEGKKKEKFSPRNNDKQDESIERLKQKVYQSPSDKKNNEEWNKEKENLLAEIEELKKTPGGQKDKWEKLTKKINGLEELAKQLLKEIQEIKAEIQEVKEEGDNSPDALFFINQKEQELQIKQSRLQELNSIINSNNNNNAWPITPIIIGGISIIALLAGLIIYQVKKTKKIRQK